MNECKWCCPMRQKFLIAVVGHLADEVVPMPVEVVDFTAFEEKSPSGLPVLHTKYCPWCGKLIGDGPRHRIEHSTGEEAET